jgi:multicomponent Na+:H+ antiporter subunit E
VSYGKLTIIIVVSSLGFLFERGSCLNVLQHEGEVLLVVVNSLFFLLIWIVLSGRTDIAHVGMGVVSSIFVAFVTRDLIVQEKEVKVKERLLQAWRFPWYFAWLLVEIFQANMHVLSLAFDRRLNDRLDPRLISFETSLTDDLARFMLAASITLTPGTVVVRMDGKKFVVHAITAKMAEGVPQEMEQRIARIFR